MSNVTLEIVISNSANTITNIITTIIIFIINFVVVFITVVSTYATILSITRVHRIVA